MAFDTKRVYITGNAFSKAPSGHTVNTSPSDIGTVDVERDITIEVTCSDATTTTAAAGFDDLFKTELVSALDTYVGTTAGVDTSGNTVDYNFNAKEVARDNIFLNDATGTFVISGKLQIAVS